MSAHILHHPLGKHLLTRLRNRNTLPEDFRSYCSVLTSLLVIEATRNLKLNDILVETPLQTTKGHELAQGLVAIPILRAGLGMLEPVTAMFPDVSVGYIGLERNEDTAIASSYYCKLPRLQDRYSLLLDPMLATGGSACHAIQLLRHHGASQIGMVSIVAAPEGIEKISEIHPDVEIYTSSIDESLNDRKYIIPGLGDFGDRLYGTFI